MKHVFGRYATLFISVALLFPRHDANAGPGIGFALSQAYAIALQSDGKILVGGTSSYTGDDQGLLLARYNNDGTLDLSFGGDGLVRTKLGTYVELISALAVQSDGAIVAAGTFYQSGYHPVLLRYEADGDLDPTFDGDGIITWSTPGDDFAADVAIQPDGKILVTGKGIVRRYASNGSLDPAFGSGGVVDLPQHDDAVWIALQPDGHIVLAAETLTRLDENGALDPTFAGDGNISLPDFATSVTLQSDGRILVGTGVPMRLARFNADGSLDLTFGVGGVGTESFGNYRSVVVQPDGRILVSFTDFDYLYARLRRCLADGSLDTSFGAGGEVAIDIGAPFAIVQRMVRRSDGKLILAGRAGRRSVTRGGSSWRWAKIVATSDGRTNGTTPVRHS